jgi:hypothetical protein
MVIKKLSRYCGTIASSIEHLSDLIPLGIIGFKSILCSSIIVTRIHLGIFARVNKLRGQGLPRGKPASGFEGVTQPISMHPDPRPRHVHVESGQWNAGTAHK